MKTAASILSIAIGTAASEFVQCGTLDAAPQLGGRWANLALAQKIAVAARPDHFDVDTYVHIVGADHAEIHGLNESVVQKQMAVINQAFAATPFNFHLKNRTSLIDDKMIYVGLDPNATSKVIHAKMPEEYCGFHDGGSIERCYKTNRRQGHYSDLNIYVITHLLNSSNAEPQLGLRGYASPPLLTPTYTEKIMDGVVVHAMTLPDQGNDNYQGYVAVHEIGHWLGLQHTFQYEDCNSVGDNVADTPAQKLPTEGCPANTTVVDTCPDHEGLDDIHNFMDESSEECVAHGLGHFTNGQIDRMRDMYEGIRHPHREH